MINLAVPKDHPPEMFKGTLKIISTIYLQRCIDRPKSRWLPLFINITYIPSIMINVELLNVLKSNEVLLVDDKRENQLT